MAIAQVRAFAKTVLPLRTRMLIRRQLVEWSLRFGQYGAQHGEYPQLKALVKPEYPNFIVDVGAYDGMVMSNSYPFTRQGWAGVMIEPHPLIYSFLMETYSSNHQVRCVNKAASDRRGVLPFFIGEGHGGLPMTSTLCQDENTLMQSRRSGQEIQVQVDTLTNILKENGAPKDFSLLLVDAEGMDYEVLAGLDFSQFTPRIVVTEEYILDVEKHNKKHQLLRDNGYALYTMLGSNTIWIRNEWVKYSVYGTRE